MHRISATLVTCDIYLCAGVPFFPAIGDNLKRNPEKVNTEYASINFQMLNV